MFHFSGESGRFTRWNLAFRFAFIATEGLEGTVSNAAAVDRHSGCVCVQMREAEGRLWRRRGRPGRREGEGESSERASVGWLPVRGFGAAWRKGWGGREGVGVAEREEEAKSPISRMCRPFLI